MATYVPEAEFNVTYYKSVPLISGVTIKQAFQQASSIPFSLIVDDELADNEGRSTYRLRILSIGSGCWL